MPSTPGIRASACSFSTTRGHHPGVADAGVFIAHKRRLGHVLAELHPGPAQVAQGLPGLPGPLALLVHLLVEFFLVQAHPLLLDHLDGQVDGEAIRVIELEGVGPGEGCLPLGLVLLQHILKMRNPPSMVLAKFSSSTRMTLVIYSCPLPELGVVPLVLMDDGVADLVEEGLVDPQEFPMPGRPAQEAAEDVAPGPRWRGGRRRRS